MKGSILGLGAESFISELGGVGSDDLADGVSGQVEITGNLSDWLVIPVVGKANLSDGFHYQHLLLGASSIR